MSRAHKMEEMQDLAWLQKKQIEGCIGALRELRSVDFPDENLFIRALMRDQTNEGLGTKAYTDDCAVDLRIDRVEYLDDKSFKLKVTPADPKAPEFPDGPLEQITLSCDKLMTAPYIPPYDTGLLEGNLMVLLSQTRQEEAAQAQSPNE